MYIKTWERCSLRLPGDNIVNMEIKTNQLKPYPEHT